MQQQRLQKSFVHVSRQHCCKAATSQHSRSIAAAAAASSDFQPLDTPSSFSSSSAASSSSSGPADTRKKVVVVGGGWAGFGAAKHLAEQGYAVTLIEASKNPGGLSGGFRTSSGKVVEAGMKGFWYSYSNIFALLKDLGGSWPLTDWTTSGFWSPKGLTTEAPVFSKLPRLPTLLGQFVHTAPLHWSLPLQVRLCYDKGLCAVVWFLSSCACQRSWASLCIQHHCTGHCHYECALQVIESHLFWFWCLHGVYCVAAVLFSASCRSCRRCWASLCIQHHCTGRCRCRFGCVS
jgi:hypothetical protein